MTEGTVSAACGGVSADLGITESTSEKATSGLRPEAGVAMNGHLSLEGGVGTSAEDWPQRAGAALDGSGEGAQRGQLGEGGGLWPE